MEIGECSRGIPVRELADRRCSIVNTGQGRPPRSTWTATRFRILFPAETLTDWGAYSQLLWGFTPGWVAGLRGDYLTHSDLAQYELLWSRSRARHALAHLAESRGIPRVLKIGCNTTTTTAMASAKITRSGCSLNSCWALMRRTNFNHG